jgi:DNA-binding IclR family transcriptional regulator
MPFKPKYNSKMILDVITTNKQSLQEIADRVGCNKETVKTYIRPLVDTKKVIEIKEKYQNATGYTYKYILAKK